MKNFRKILQERVERLDPHALNRARLVAVLFSALIFGVSLRFIMFPVTGISPRTELVASAAGLDAASASPVVLSPLITEEPVSTPLTTSEPVSMPAVPNVSASAATSTLELVSPAPLEPVLLSAREALVTNGPSLRGIVYQKDADEKVPPASLTKIMTAVVVIEYGHLDDILTVSARAAATIAPTGGLVEGETLTVGDTLTIMLVASSNGAAVALSNYFASQGIDLVALMNKKARALGMFNTHFANPNGLDDDAHYSSARDLAALTAYSLQYENIWKILSLKSVVVSASDGSVIHRLTTTNQLLLEDVAYLKAGKTGYTPKAQGCMISLLVDGSIVVVLGSENRELDSKKLIAAKEQL